MFFFILFYVLKYLWRIRSTSFKTTLKRHNLRVQYSTQTYMYLLPTLLSISL
jgi:hypothetical protein